MDLREVDALIALLETGQSTGDAVRRRVLNEERCALMALRTERVRTRGLEKALQEVVGSSDQELIQRAVLRKQISRGCSAFDLTERVEAARRVLKMYDG